MNKLLLFILILIAFFIRFINYRYPPLLWDEAAIGYNAYSLLQTGRDEYGQSFPLVFKSFGDYKPGIYIYATLPFVAIFGLNELSVRLPSIIVGSLLPLIFYLLIRKLLPRDQKIAFLAALLLVFNPWNIHFSRGAWETNLLLFELVLSSLFFLNKRFFFSALFMGLGLYTYQAAKLLVPILTLLLFFQSKKISKLYLSTLFLFSLPILFGLLFGADANRLKVMNLYSYQRPPEEVNQIISESGSLDYQLFHSHPLFFLQNFLTRYFNYFSPRFLIFEGDWQISRHSAPYVGVILYPTLIFFILGFFSSLRVWRRHLFFLFWLFLSPLPAALSLDIIQPVRSLSLSLPILYFAAIGLSLFKQRLILLIIFILYLFSFLYYQEAYTFHLTKIKPSQWLVGYKEAVEYIVVHGQNRQVSFTQFYGQPYIYYLFYTQYSPRLYQSQAFLTTNGVDVGTVNHVDKILFQNINIQSLKSSAEPVLSILSYDEIIRQGYKPEEFIKLSPLFYVYQN